MSDFLAPSEHRSVWRAAVTALWCAAAGVAAATVAAVGHMTSPGSAAPPSEWVASSAAVVPWWAALGAAAAAWWAAWALAGPARRAQVLRRAARSLRWGGALGVLCAGVLLWAEGVSWVRVWAAGLVVAGAFAAGTLLSRAARAVPTGMSPQPVAVLVVGERSWERALSAGEVDGPRHWVEQPEPAPRPLRAPLERRPPTPPNTPSGFRPGDGAAARPR